MSGAPAQRASWPTSHVPRRLLGVILPEKCGLHKESQRSRVENGGWATRTFVLKDIRKECFYAMESRQRKLGLIEPEKVKGRKGT